MNKNFVRMFQPRFAALVDAGVKKQTVRPVPKRLPEPGDLLDAREWIGRPYRSKQRKIGRFRITRVCPIFIDAYGVSLGYGNGRWIAVDPTKFARADGFEGFEELWSSFWEFYHEERFHGIVIFWDPQSRKEDNA